jgi:hypothetical protein
MMQQGWALLDIRPPGEVQKVGIIGAVTVPLYVEDPSNSFSSLLKKSATIGTGGWWLGGTHMIPNNDFLAQVCYFCYFCLLSTSVCLLDCYQIECYKYFACTGYAFPATLKRISGPPPHMTVL